MSDRPVHLGIVELGDTCVRMRAMNLDLFGELGAWLTRTPAGPTQRWLSAACHRHAWHAELWERRTPSIPRFEDDAAITEHRRQRLPEQPDAAAYQAEVGRIIDELAAFADRVDADLDPSTRRTITLVRTDLADLVDHDPS